VWRAQKNIPRTEGNVHFRKGGEVGDDQGKIVGVENEDIVLRVHPKRGNKKNDRPGALLEAGKLKTISIPGLVRTRLRPQEKMIRPKGEILTCAAPKAPVSMPQHRNLWLPRNRSHQGYRYSALLERGEGQGHQHRKDRLTPQGLTIQERRESVEGGEREATWKR